MQVLIGFDLFPNGIGDWFTLDDPTKGVLDSGYKLPGNVLVDVTPYVRAVTVNRGRSRQLEKFTAGAANLVLDNRSRIFDPLNAASPYRGNLVPGKQVLISSMGAPIYAGNVADWSYSYDLNGDATAEPSCSDAFAYFATRDLTAGTATAQLTGARVNAVLDAIGWADTDRDISAGQATLDADVVPVNQNALAYLQKVELSETGALFMGKQGFVTFRDRGDLQEFDTQAVFGPSGIPFESIGVVYGVEELWNKVSVTYTAGSVIAGTAIAEDLDSQHDYGVFQTNYDTLLGTLADAQEVAQRQVARYSQPQYRIEEITVNLTGVGPSIASQVLALDLGDVVEVSWTPNSVGSAITQYVAIDGIRHEATPEVHRVSLRMSEASASFTLDNPVFGVLDQNPLGI